MTPDEAIAKLEHFEGLVKQTILPFTVKMGFNAKALIQRRIQEESVMDDGSPLAYVSEEMEGAYSTGYARKRKARGRQIERVDLTMTRGGAGMFGSTGIVMEEFDGETAKVKVGGKDAFTDDKLTWNTERYGTILKLSKDEENIIEEAYDNYVNELAQEAGLI